jgi:hypothetical protein
VKILRSLIGLSVLDGLGRSPRASREVSGRLTDNSMCLLADPRQHVDPCASGISTPERQGEPRVHDSTLPVDGGMAHVHGAGCVHRHISSAGWESDLRESPTLPSKSGLHQGPVGSGDNGELTRAFVCARHRDSYDEPTALVGMSPETTVLVPWQVGNALDDPDGLHESLDPIALGACRVAVDREPANPQKSVIIEQSSSCRAVILKPLKPYQAVLTRRRTRPP